VHGEKGLRVSELTHTGKRGINKIEITWLL
jgi:hypothetical protein